MLPGRATRDRGRRGSSGGADEPAALRQTGAMTQPDPVMIRATDLGRRFGSLWAIRGVDLEVHRGEVLGLLGPNGAGKTTTVRLLTALIEPSEGRRTVDGLDVVERSDDVRSRVGILTETPGLYDKLSATANLDFFGRLYGLDAATRAERIERYLRLFSLWERRDDVAGTFSKGMKQKLAIARALLHDPAVVFLDEPTAALDPEAAYIVREAIEALRRARAHDRAGDAQPRRGGSAVRPGRVHARRACCGSIRRHGSAARSAVTASRSGWARAARCCACAAVARACRASAPIALTGTRLLVTTADPAAVTPAIVRALVARRCRCPRGPRASHRRSSRSTSTSWAFGPTRTGGGLMRGSDRRRRSCAASGPRRSATGS